MIDLCADHGLVLEPHQQLVLQGALGENPDPKRPGQWKWAAFEVGVVEPRQNGKGGIITARQLGGLYLFGERLQTYTAHRMDACKEAFHKIREVIDNHDDLRRRVKTITEVHGDERIELQNPRQRLLFKTRAKASGRAFSGDTVYLDELLYLLGLGDLVPTMSARPNPQLWQTSSAPLPRAESDALRALCKRGRAGARRKGPRPHRLAYFEWSASLPKKTKPDRASWDKAVAALLADPKALAIAQAEANPGMGYRLTAEFMVSERAAIADDAVFALERLGLFPEKEEILDPAFDAGDWTACASATSEIVKPGIAYAFEVSLDRRWSTIAAAGASSDEGAGTHVEVGDNRPGTDWVVKRLIELRDEHHPTAIVCNPAGPAGALLPECQRLGLKVGVVDLSADKPSTGKPAPAKLRPVSARDYVQACGAAYDAIVAHQWRHADQPELNTAVTGAAKRDSGDAFVFDRRAGVDISPFLAVTLAAWAAGRPVVETPPSAYEDRGLTVL